MRFHTLVVSFIATSSICSASPMPQDVAVAATIPPSTSSSFSGTKAGDGKLNEEKAPGAQQDQGLQKKQAIPPSTSSSFSGTKAGDGKLNEEKAPGALQDQGLQKKQAIVAVVTIKVVSIIAKIAIELATDTLKNLGEWNEVREAFTQTTTLEMWNRNPDFAKYHAAICYNKAYRVENPAGIAELASAKLELGLLNTDYDCMFMDAPNQFLTDTEGGFINLAYRYDDRCTFDENTGDLTCV